MPFRRDLLVDVPIGATLPRKPTGAARIGEILIDFAHMDFSGPYVAGSIPVPIHGSPYNDDVAIPNYATRGRDYAGTQRQCIRDERPEALSIEDHVRAALEAPFFLSSFLSFFLSCFLAFFLSFSGCRTSPHTNTGGGIYGWGPPPGDIKKFRTQQAIGLRDVQTSKRPAPKKWHDCAPETPNGVTLSGPPMLTFLFKRFGRGGSRRLKQLVFGFPITGTLSQGVSYPVDSMAKLDILSPEHPSESAFARFQHRDTSAVPQRAS